LKRRSTNSEYGTESQIKGLNYQNINNYLEDKNDNEYIMTFNNFENNDILLSSEIESRKISYTGKLNKFSLSNKEMNELKRNLNNNVYLEYCDKFKKKLYSCDEILNSFFPYNLKLNFENVYLKNKKKNKISEFILHLKRNYFNDCLINEKKSLNNSTEKNNSRIINRSINSKSDIFYDNLPNLHSDFLKLEYKTEEIMNKTFDLYEENVLKIGNQSRRDRRMQMNDCFQLDIGRDNANNANRIIYFNNILN